MAKEKSTERPVQDAEQAVGIATARRGLWSKRWIRWIAYLVMAGVVIMIAAPYAMTYYLQKWLIENGADEATVADIDFNPFAGSLRLEGFDVKLNGRTVMGDVDIYVDVGLNALITRTVTIEKATLENVVLEIERLADGRMRIGSVVVGESVPVKSAMTEAMPSEEGPTDRSVDIATGAAAESAAAEEGRPWLVNLRHLRMTDSEVRYISPELTTTVAVTEASVDRVYTGFSSERGVVKLDGKLDGAPVNLDVAFNINPGITVDGAAKVDGLKLELLAGLVREQAQKLAGVVSLDGKVMFADGPERPMTAKYDGSLSLTDVEFANGDMDVTGQTIGWNGEVAFAAEPSARTLGVDGALDSGGLDLRMPAQQLNLKQSAIAISGKTDVKLGDAVEAKYSGEITLTGTAFDTPDLKAAGESLAWNGDVVFAATPGPTQDIALDGSLRSSELKLELAAQQMSVAQREFRVEGKTSVQLGEVMRASYAGAIAVNGNRLESPQYTVDGESISWDGALAFANDGGSGQVIDVDGTLSVGGLAADLSEQAIRASQGEIGLEANKIKLTLAPDGFDVSGNASLTGSNTEVKQAETDALLLSLTGLGVNDVAAASGKQITIAGIQLDGLKAGNPQSPDMTLALDALALETITVAELADVRVGKVKATRIEAVDQAKEIMLMRLEELGIAGVATSGTQKVSVETVSLSETTLLSKLSKPDAPMGKVGSTTLSSLAYTPEGLVIDSVDIGAVQAKIVREKPAGAAGGKPAAATEAARAEAAVEAAVEAGDKDTAATEAPPEGGTKDADRFKFNIRELALAGDSAVFIEDHTVTPTFRTELRIAELKLKSRDPKQSFGPMDLTFRGGIGEYATIEMNGTADAAARSIDVKLDIADANMIVLTPYTNNMMGYGVDSGHLSLDAKIGIAGGRIDAENKLFLRELYMTKASEELAAQAAEEIGVPVEEAMNMLRDKQGNITLDVPLSGPLTQLQVGLGDIIGKAVGSAVKMATVNYLKYINPTYGVGVTVIQKVKEQLEKIRVDPIEYPAGKTELPAAAQEMVTKAAAELTKDSKLDVRLCPFATPEDVAALDGAPGAGDLGKEMIDKVILLGHNRASAVKKALVTQHKIEPGRLVVCVTKYDKEEKAKPRVEFLF